MKKDLDITIKGLDGKPLNEPVMSPEPNQEVKAWRIGIAIANALVGVFQDEQNLNGVEKALRFKLAMRCMNCGTQDFQAQDLTRIDTVCSKAYGSLVYGQVEEWINSDKAKVVPINPGEANNEAESV